MVGENQEIISIAFFPLHSPSDSYGGVTAAMEDCGSDEGKEQQ